jgi:succinate-semialdehyde dehydrogenase/glutarate-semialdehyde dehydrogenase
MRYEGVDPATEDPLWSFPCADDAEVERAVAGAYGAYERWRASPPRERGAALRAVADILERDAGRHATTMATEMGKPIGEGEAEARKCAWACRYFAGEAERLLAPTPRESDGSRAVVRREPLGPILAVMPWNFPFWQVFRFAAPALVLGNTALLKPAPSTPECGREVERVFREAGIPEGVLATVFLSDSQVARVVADPRVRGVTLTGSTRAGREVAAAAGRHLKPMVMELGGSDPFLVFADADIDEAARTGVAARCLNSGQSCIAAKRFLVERPVLDRFTTALVEGMAARRLGDPRHAGTQVGPLARRDLRETLARQVDRSAALGARVLLGGRAPDRRGFFYLPTVLAEVHPHSPAATEELFGPVAAIFPFDDEEEALRLANGTPYGLGASFWTSDAARRDRLVPRIEAGSVFVNGLVKSDPRLPFGGVKDSGFGRELGAEGLDSFANLKTVWTR